VVDEGRQVELQVRTAYSDFVGAREVLDSQKTVQAEAEEALREAEARAAAGTGTQLDVLDAQTSLTKRARRRCWRCTIMPPLEPGSNAPLARTWFKPPQTKL